MGSVTQLKPVRSVAIKSNRKMARKMKRQGLSAVGVGLVAATLTGLSLSHLAHGIEIVTVSPAWEAWAMAVGIDLGFVALELSQLTAATEKVQKQISKFTRPAIVGTLVGSAAMNAFAFASGTSNIYIQGVAAGFGVAIPLLVYALTRVGANLYIDCHSKA